VACHSRVAVAEEGAPVKRRKPLKSHASAIDFDEMVEGYVGAMLAVNTLNPETFESVDSRDDFEDTDEVLATDAGQGAIEDCDDFLGLVLEEAPKDLIEYEREYGSEPFGQDFALSRNGHGAGFFDKGFDKLQKLARSYGANTWENDGGTLNVLE
jgi:hypothetical protein